MMATFRCYLRPNPSQRGTAMKALPLVVVVVGLSGLNLSAVEPEWDKKKAAARLDERAKSWITKGSKLATDAAGEVTCVSCHTTAPYALARPVLGKVLDAKGAIPVLDDLLKD